METIYNKDGDIVDAIGQKTGEFFIMIDNREYKIFDVYDNNEITIHLPKKGAEVEIKTDDGRIVKLFIK